VSNQRPRPRSTTGVHRQPSRAIQAVSPEWHLVLCVGRLPVALRREQPLLRCLTPRTVGAATVGRELFLPAAKLVLFSWEGS